MRLRFFGITLALFVFAVAARADELYTVSYSYYRDSGTYTFVEPSIVTSPFTVNASDLTSDVESGDVLTSISLNPTTDFGDGAACASSDGGCVNLFFSPVGGLGLVEAAQFFNSDLLSPGFYQVDGGDITVSIQNIAPAPEPGSLALLGTGMLGFAGVLRKRFA